MPISFDGIISDRNVRWSLASMAFVISLGIATFIIVRLQAVEDLQKENLQLKSEVADLQKQLETQVGSAQQRIAALETTTFGTLVPEAANATLTKPLVVLSAPAQWQVNRDKALQARIRALEEWRMRHEDEK